MPLLIANDVTKKEAVTLRKHFSWRDGLFSYIFIPLWNKCRYQSGEENRIRMS